VSGVVRGVEGCERDDMSVSLRVHSVVGNVKSKSKSKSRCYSYSQESKVL
jgi:hypothetical protein